MTLPLTCRKRQKCKGVLLGDIFWSKPVRIEYLGKRKTERLNYITLFNEVKLSHSDASMILCAFNMKITIRQFNLGPDCTCMHLFSGQKLLVNTIIKMPCIKALVKFKCMQLRKEYSAKIPREYKIKNSQASSEQNRRLNTQ